MPKALGRTIITEVNLMIGNIKNLYKIRSMLDACYEHPEKYIAEELLPIVNFRRTASLTMWP
jgi:hypothetical protein